MSSCAGCAAKLSPVLLKEALSGLLPGSHPNVLVGAETMDDAGVYQISEHQAIINTTDFFTPIVDDPYLFGAIAATNAMSDVYAMGGEVLTALNILSYPSELPLDIMREILRAASAKVKEADGVLIGGHTVATETLMFGLAVTGTIHPAAITSNANARPGEALILCKPLGTGIITTAIKRDILTAKDGQEAFASMTQLNRAAAQIMLAHGARAATDITGFGLLGHALHIAQGSGVTLEIDARQVPLFAAAWEMAERGVATGAAANNHRYIAEATRFTGARDETRLATLLDPQTSGGLFFTVATDRVEAALKAMHLAGFSRAAAIGKTVPAGDRPLVVHM